MEATGVYWKPVWAVLCEGDFALVLANAHHVKAVPGRKTDVNDATWLADLLAHGLIRPSFVPPMAVQALRELTRTRKQLTREKAAHVQRIDRLPTSSSARSSPTSWARAGGPSSMPWPAARAMPKRSPP
jgi:transposase